MVQLWHMPQLKRMVKCLAFKGMTCFQIAHHPICKGLFTVIKRKGKSFCRTILPHSIVQEVNNLHLLDLPSRSTQEKSVCGKVGRPPTTIAVTDLEEEVVSPLSGANRTY